MEASAKPVEKRVKKRSNPTRELVQLFADSKAHQPRPLTSIKPKTECYLISAKSTTNELQKELYAKNKRVLSWHLPHPAHIADPTKEIEFCFDIDEVREYILDKTKDETQGDVQNINSDPQPIPMFRAEQMRQILLTLNNNEDPEVRIADEMPVEFRHVFLEIGVMLRSKQPGPKTNDTIAAAATSVVREYVQTQQAATPDVQPESEKKAEEKVTWSNQFWGLTKKYLTSAATGAVRFAGKIGTRVIEFILRNPIWMTVITTLSQMIRIVLCVCTSVTDVPKLGTQLLQIMREKLVAVFGPYVAGPLLIMEGAMNLLNCAATLNLESCTNSAWAIGTGAGLLLQSLGSIIGRFGSKILNMIGLGWLMPIVGPILDTGTETFKKMLQLDQYSTSLINMASVINRMTSLDFDLFTVVMLLDFMARMVPDNESKFVKYVLAFFPNRLATAIQNSIEKANKKWSFLRIYVGYMKQAAAVVGMKDTLFEIHAWITDVAPCLFRYVTSCLKSVLTFGILRDQETSAACCMKSLVMAIQRNVMLGEKVRNETLAAEATLDLANEHYKAAENAKGAYDEAYAAAQKEQTWTDWMLRRPFNAENDALIVAKGNELSTATKLAMETKSKYEQFESADYNKNWNEWSNELGYDLKKKRAAAAPMMVPTSADSLWVAQTATNGPVFPQPIFVFEKRIPFYVDDHASHEYDSRVSMDRPWCVAPSLKHMQQHIPDAVWSFQGKSYLLLHKLPAKMIEHMAKLNTPIFTLG